MSIKKICVIVVFVGALILVLCNYDAFKEQQATADAVEIASETITEVTTESTTQNPLAEELSKLSEKAEGSGFDKKVLTDTGSIAYNIIDERENIKELSDEMKKCVVKLSYNFSYVGVKTFVDEDIYINLYKNNWSVAEGVFLKRTMPTRSLSEFADFVVGETSRDEIKAFDTPVYEEVEPKSFPISTMHLTNDGYAVIIGYVEDYLRDNNKNLVVASVVYVPMKSTKKNEELLLSCLSPADKEAFEKNFEGGYYQFVQEFSTSGLYENSLYDYKNLRAYMCKPLVLDSRMLHAYGGLFTYLDELGAATTEHFDEHISLGELTNNFTK